MTKSRDIGAILGKLEYCLFRIIRHRLLRIMKEVKGEKTEIPDPEAVKAHMINEGDIPADLKQRISELQSQLE